MASVGGIYDLLGEKELFCRISTGEESAFKLIFDRYKARIFTFVVSFIHSNVDAEEIVQETFLSLWQNRSHLPVVEHPRNYLYTMVRNKTLRYISNAVRDEKMLKIIWANMQLEVNSTEEEFQWRESKARIAKALAMMPEQKQRIFKMCREDGLSHEAIAEQMGLSKSRVKNIMVEILKYIKLCLAQDAVVLTLFFALYIFFKK